jgi:hypothetical protein
MVLQGEGAQAVAAPKQQDGDDLLVRRDHRHLRSSRGMIPPPSPDRLE